MSRLLNRPGRARSWEKAVRVRSRHGNEARASRLRLQPGSCGGGGVRRLGVETEAEAARGREGSTGVAQVLPLGVIVGGGGGSGALGAPPPRGAAPPGGAARHGVRVGAGGADREGHLRLPLHDLPRHRWLAPRLRPLFPQGVLSLH